MKSKKSKEYLKLIENNKEWAATVVKEDPEFFSRLSNTQKPDFLWIGCSDSRVPADRITGTQPGEIFVHRNIANMVTNNDLSAMSVINYAITQLKVKHIVICGHYNCGGVQSAMQSSDLGILNPWLRNIRDVYRIHQEELNNIEDEDDRFKKLVEFNVQEQCVNIIKTPEVQRALKSKEVTVSGWVFDLQTGVLIDLKIDFDNILEHIMEIYHIV